MSKANKILFVYGCDSIKEGTACGPETIARCDVAINIIKNDRDSFFIIILAAGKDRRYPDAAPLKEIMSVYLEKRLSAQGIFLGTGRCMITYPEQNAWGTLRETYAAYECMRIYKSVETIVVSSGYHIPRIKRTWRALGIWADTFVSVPYPASPKTLLLEPIKRAWMLWEVRNVQFRTALSS